MTMSEETNTASTYCGCNYLTVAFALFIVLILMSITGYARTKEPLNKPESSAMRLLTSPVSTELPRALRASRGLVQRFPNFECDYNRLNGSEWEELIIGRGLTPIHMLGIFLQSLS